MLRNNSIRIDPWSHWANVAQESWESWLESVVVRRAMAGAAPDVDGESQPIVLPQEDHPGRSPAARAPRRAKPVKQRNVRIG